MGRRVVCTIKFFYDADTYIYWDEDEDAPEDSVILGRCREMMLEDITNAFDPLDESFIDAQFVNEQTLAVELL